MKTLSARRTLVVYRLWLNKPGKPDEVFWTNDIAGVDILEVFGEFTSQMPNSWLRLPERLPGYANLTRR